MDQNKKIMLFIPVFNCEKQIIRTISRISENFQKQISLVYIVDNRSSDLTVECAAYACNKYLKYCNFNIVKNDSNYNLGGSHKVAINYGLSNKFYKNKIIFTCYFHFLWNNFIKSF